MSVIWHAFVQLHLTRGGTTLRWSRREEPTLLRGGDRRTLFEPLPRGANVVVPTAPPSPPFDSGYLAPSLKPAATFCPGAN